MDVSLRTLLVRPRTAFAEAGDPGLLQPTALTLVTGVASMVTVLPLYVLLGRELPATVPRVRFATGGGTAAIPQGFLLGMVLAMLLMGLFWVLTTGALAVGARLAGGEGRFRDLLAFVGWSHLPQLVTLAVILGVALVLAATRDATVAEVLHGTDPLAAGSAVTTMDGQGLMDGRSLLALAGTAWTAYIWVGGLEVSHGLSRRRAATVAATLALLVTLLTANPF
jgi:hypothetical protein